MDEQPQPEILRIHLTRRDSGLSWGFRLQGGVDFNTPLSVQVVQPKSPADKSGLKAGDGILQINNAVTDGLSHEQAKMEIIRSCNDIDMIIQRGAVTIWKPKVTPLSDLRPQEPQLIQSATGDQVQVTQRTSLAKTYPDREDNIGTAYNRSARPFPGGGGSQGPQSPKQAIPNVVHAQFNTPIGLYSADNIAKSYADQTAGIQRQMSDLDVEGKDLGTRMTGTYQVLDQDKGPEYGTPFSPTSPKSGDTTETNDLGDHDGDLIPRSRSPECLLPENGLIENEHEPEEKEPSPSPQDPGFRSVAPPTAKPPGQTSSVSQQSMHCNECGNLVTGVFVRVKGMPYHEKCFKCKNCGLYLKQKGYFMIDGGLYCEIHARRVAEAPGDNYRPAGAVYR